jgi:hypothetical protein
MALSAIDHTIHHIIRGRRLLTSKLSQTRIKIWNKPPDNASAEANLNISEPTPSDAERTLSGGEKKGKRKKKDRTKDITGSNQLSLSPIRVGAAAISKLSLVAKGRSTGDRLRLLSPCQDPFFYFISTK